MSKDYKPRQTSSRGKNGGGLLLGLFIGFLLGLGVAAAIAIYFFKTPVPFINRVKPPDKAGPGLPEAPRQGKAEETKPRFDFYRILPGQEEAVTDQQMKQAAQAAAKAGTPPSDTYILQAGAFQNPADADNLKARLALLGLEAAVEPTNLPDKGVWYRVRLGPYARVDEINRVRAQLAQNGVEASVVKIKDGKDAARNP
jgi:cell division protein FtsN